MARIKWAEHVEQNGLPNTHTQQQQNQQQPFIPFVMPNGNQSRQQNPGRPTPGTPFIPGNTPQYNYPGYGGHVARVTRGQINEPAAMNADEYAAMEATVQNWNVKPTAFKSTQVRNTPTIRRTA